MRAHAALVAASAVAREFLAEFGVEIQSYVTRIGAAAMREQPIDFEALRYTPLEIESSPVRCPSAQASRAMEEEIAAARAAGVRVRAMCEPTGGECQAGVGVLGSPIPVSLSVCAGIHWSDTIHARR